MPAWTTTEVRRLRNLHKGDAPTSKQLSQHFSRHTVEAVRVRAIQMKLREGTPPQNFDAERLLKAREYLTGRGQAVLAYLGVAVAEAAE